MAVDIINNGEVSITPNKRKRISFQLENGKTNEIALKVENKENFFVYNPFMETKSIEEIAAATSNTENPYEVIRKPPKKKKKQDIEECCFTNPALNLDGPEKVINPFEIRRTVSDNQNSLCFTNSGLNIRAAEKEVMNPFEIVRQAEPIQHEGGKGIENPALEMPPTRAIGLPFTPTIGCRIDFKDVPLESITPCTLLNKALTFTPDKVLSIQTPVRTPHPNGLSVISEESFDIEEKLDSYQLELENSINEAKSHTKKERKDNLMNVKHKKTFAERLKSLSSKDEQVNNVRTEHEKHRNLVSNVPDVMYEEVNESFSDTNDDNDDFDFKNPAPFVRTYRKSERPKNSTSIESARKDSVQQPHNTIRNSIRNSFRKLLNHKTSSNKSSNNSNNTKESDEETNIFSTLRRSFRHKPSKPAVHVERESHEISILVETERKVFKQVSEKQTEISEQNIQKVSIRNSVRRSTRGIRKQVLKSVFKKNVEDYNLD